MSDRGGVPFGGPDGGRAVSQATEAVLFNGVPLLLLAAAYAAVTGRDPADPLASARARRTRSTGRSCSSSPASPSPPAIFGVLVVHERRPFGGHTWLSFAAILVALAPAAAAARALARPRAGRRRDRPHPRGRGARLGSRPRARGGRGHLERARPGARRRRTPRARSCARSRRCSASASPASSSSRTEATSATGVYAELNGEPAAWWEEVQVDLRNEPSGIASAVFDAAPVTVYDIAQLVARSARGSRRWSARRAAPGCR